MGKNGIFITGVVLRWAEDDVGSGGQDFEKHDSNLTVAPSMKVVAADRSHDVEYLGVVIDGDGRLWVRVPMAGFMTRLTGH